MVDEMRNNIEAPIVFMSYLNPIYTYGIEKGFAMLKGRADGLITPDAVPEESSKFEKTAVKNNISLIPLVAPNTSIERMKYISAKAQAFTYIVSLTGVTGNNICKCLRFS